MKCISINNLPLTINNGDRIYIMLNKQYSMLNLLQHNNFTQRRKEIDTLTTNN